MPDDAIVTADGNGGNEGFREAHQDALKIIGCREAGCQRRIGQDDVIAGRNVIMGILEGQPHIAFPAKDVDNPSRILQGVNFLPRISKNDSVKICIFHH